MKRTVNKIDYSKAMLPRTRKEQFGDCFKMNYLILLKCGLILLLFSLPLIAFCFFMDFYYEAIMATFTSSSTPIEITRATNLFLYFLNTGIVVLSLIVIVAIGGVTHILRNFIWGEGIYFTSDFNQGVKANTPKNLIFGFVIGLIFFASLFVMTLFNSLIVAYIPLVIFAVIFFPVYFWMIFLNNTYSSKWTGLVRNSFYFYVKTIGWSILGILMPLSLISLILMPIYLIWLKYVIIVLFIVFVFPIILLIMTLYTTSKFDENINKEHYPDYYMKGLNHD